MDEPRQPELAFRIALLGRRAIPLGGFHLGRLGFDALLIGLRQRNLCLLITRLGQRELLFERQIIQRRLTKCHQAENWQQSQSKDGFSHGGNIVMTVRLVKLAILQDELPSHKNRVILPGNTKNKG